jgi:RND superfamily putative drug exporter
MYLIIFIVLVIVGIILYTKVRGPGGAAQSLRNLAHGYGTKLDKVDPATQAQGILSQIKDKMDDAAKRRQTYWATLESRQRKVNDLLADVKEWESRRNHRMGKNDVDGATEAQRQLDMKTEALHQAEESLANANKQFEASQAEATQAQQDYELQREQLKELVSNDELAKADEANNAVSTSLDLSSESSQLAEAMERLRQRTDTRRAPAVVDTAAAARRNRVAEDREIANADARRKVEELMKSRGVISTDTKLDAPKGA